MQEIDSVILLALLSTARSLHKLSSCAISIIHPVRTIEDKDLTQFFPRLNVICSVLSGDKFPEI